MKKIFNLKINTNIASYIVFITLGGILIFSGVGKIIKPPTLEHLWLTQVLGKDITNILKTALPYCEFIIGILLCFRIKVKYLAWVALALIMLFITNNIWLISIGSGWESCGQCLGWGIDTWTGASLYIDLTMLGLLLAANSFYRNRELNK